jgi:hypothetical protein
VLIARQESRDALLPPPERSAEDERVAAKLARSFSHLGDDFGRTGTAGALLLGFEQYDVHVRPSWRPRREHFDGISGPRYDGTRRIS